MSSNASAWVTVEAAARATSYSVWTVYRRLREGAAGVVGGWVGRRDRGAWRVRWNASEEWPLEVEEAPRGRR